MANKRIPDVKRLREQAKQLHCDERTFPGVGQILQDTQYTFRQLRKSPGFTVTAAVARFLEETDLTKKPKILSAAGRARIVEAQRLRWAKVKGKPREIAAASKKCTRSAAARKRIAAAQRARWAKVRAQKKAA